MARFTFDTFMVGPSNEVACAAARSVVNGSPSPFNPAFFYGDYGAGKTHLARRIGEMPVGLVSALVGAPVLVLLIRRRKALRL